MTLDIALPLMLPNRPLDTTATLPAPPLYLPKMEVAKSRKNLPPPANNTHGQPDDALGAQRMKCQSLQYWKALSFQERWHFVCETGVEDKKGAHEK
jgi:hypothetical protein